MKRLAVWIVLGVAALALAAGASLLWYTSPRAVGVLTDGDTIRLDAGDKDQSRPVLWQPATPLPAVVNSSEPEYEPRFSEDGNTLFFVRGKAGANADIYQSTRTFDGWSEPRPVGVVNTDADELGPCPSLDGRDLYFYSNRPGGQGGYDLWVSHRQDSEWLPPTNLGAAVNSPLNDYGPAVSPDGTRVYFASNRPRPSEEGPGADAWPATLREQLYQHDYDIYSTALAADGAGVAEPVAALNSPRDEGAPCIAPFGDFLYFASDRSGGLGGLDLYRARVREGVPGEPENLGPAVNSPANDLDPALTMGGFALYFSSDRAAPAGAEPRDAAPALQAPADYNLYRSISREVYRDTRLTRRAVNWSAIWNAVLLLLLLALLALLLWTIARARSSDRFRRLSLFAKCVLVSLLIHSLLLLLMAFWQVGSAIQGLLQHSSGTRVALTSGHGSDTLTTQVRGGLTDVSITTSAPAPQAAAVPEQAPALDAARLASSELTLAARPQAPRPVGDSNPAVEALARPLEAPDPAPRQVQAPAAPAPEPAREVATVVGDVPRVQAAPRALDPTDLRHADAAAMDSAATRTSAAPLAPAVSSADAAVTMPLPPPATEVAEATPRDVNTPAAAAARHANESPTSVTAASAAQADRPAQDGAPEQSRAAIAPGGASAPVSPMAIARAPDAVPAGAAGATTLAQVAPAAGDSGLPVQTPATPPPTASDEASAAVRAAWTEASGGEHRPSTPASSVQGRGSTAALASSPTATGAPAASLAGVVSVDAAPSGGDPGVAVPAAAMSAAVTRTSERTPAPAAPSARGERSTVIQAAEMGAGAAQGRPDAPRSSDAATLAALTSGRVAAAPPTATLARADTSDASAGAGAVAVPTADPPALGHGAEIASPQSVAPSVRGEASATVQFAAQGAGPATSHPDAPRSIAGDAGALASLDAGAARAAATPMPVAQRPPVDAAPAATTAAAPASPESAPLAGVATPRGAQAIPAAESGVPVDIASAARDAPRLQGAAPPSGGGITVAALDAPGAVASPVRLSAAAHAEDAPPAASQGAHAALPGAAALQGRELLRVSTPEATRQSASPESPVAGALSVADAAPSTARPSAPPGSAPGEAFGVPADPTRTSATPGIPLRFADAPQVSPAEAPASNAAAQLAPATRVAVAAPAASDAPGAVSGEASPRVDAAPTSEGAARPATAASPSAAPGLPPSNLAASRVSLATARPMAESPAVRDANPAASRGTAARQPLLELPRLAALAPMVGTEERGTRAAPADEAPSAGLELAAPAAGGVRAAIPGAARDHTVQRVALAPASSSPEPAAGPLSRVLAVPDAASIAPRGERRGANLPASAAPAMAIPLPGPDAAALPNPRGTLSGIVVDASNNRPIEGATVRLDMPSGRPVTVETGPDGAYVLQASDLPDHVAVSASHEGYTPDSASVASQKLLEGARQDFRLAPTERNLIALEGDPEVHHLGNDEFEGRINSQFQRPSEGLVYEAVFRLAAEQAPPSISRAEIVMLVRGAQAPNEIRINGWLLDQRLDESPEDGSFGEFRASIPVQALSRGDNALTIRSRRGSSDLDDFEFVNVRVRLVRSATRAE